MNDFRPISLIGIQYKIIAKVLVLRFVGIKNVVVSCEQSTFVKDRHV